jgi:hypothetical protein
MACAALVRSLCTSKSMASSDEMSPEPKLTSHEAM